VTRDVLNISVILDEDNVQISFDFLDRGDGVTFEMFYSAEGEDDRIFSSGTIKGAKQGIWRRIDMREAGRKTFPFNILNLNPVMVVTVGSVIYLALSVVAFIAGAPTKNGHTTIDWNTFGLAIALAFVGCLSAIAATIAYLWSHVPRDLRKLATAGELPNWTVPPNQSA
jgi:hypothetical protein